MKSRSLSVVFGLLAASTVQGAILDFEDVATGLGNVTTDGDIVSGGFLFDSAINHLHRNNEAGHLAASGSTNLTIHDLGGINSLTMSAVGGGTFSLNTAQLAESYNSSSGNLSLNASTVTVTGFLFGGGTITQTVTLDGITDGPGGAADFQNVVFGAGWTNLTSVLFDGTGGGEAAWEIDNIGVNQEAVPEPATFAIVGLGALGLAAGALRRRFRKAA